MTGSQPSNVQIRVARERANLSMERVAKAAGLSVHEYDDLEAYEDEAVDVVTLGKIGSVCGELGLDICELYGLPPATSELDRDVVGKMMQQQGWTVPRLADEVGIVDSEISKVAVNIGCAKEWVFLPISDLATALNIDLSALLRSILRTP